MRVTDGRLDLASSHAYSTSLQGHRQVTAWDPTGRVELTDDVKVTLSGADAAVRLNDAARDLTDRAGMGPGLGRGMGLGLGLGQLGRPNGPAAGGGLRGPTASIPHPAASAGTDAASQADDDPMSALSADQRAWVMLLRLTGDEASATRLADRIAALARAMKGMGSLSERMERLAAKYAAAAVPATSTPAQAPAQAPAEDWGYREDVSVKVTESEATSFAAAGTVRTADGRTIDVAAAFELVRSSTTEVSASVRLGAAAHDPLVLSLNGAPPSIGAGTQQVDVDNDGAGETVAALAPGTAYLVRDLNGNGVVDGGSELFGPATEDGFGELSALDGDGNGWVDEGDAAFTQLSLWSGEQGAALVSLRQAGVGALAADSISTPYTYGATTGVLAASSVFLYEDGRAGIAGELKLYA